MCLILGSSIQERLGHPGVHPAEDNKGDKGTV